MGMLTTKKLYELLEKNTSKKGGRMTVREICDELDEIMPRVLPLLQFGEVNSVIVRLDDENYKARRRDKIPKEVFLRYIDTDVDDILGDKKYSKSFWIYVNKSEANRKRRKKDLEKILRDEKERINKCSYDEISRFQYDSTIETGHGRSKKKEWKESESIVQKRLRNELTWAKKNDPNIFDRGAMK